MDDALAARRLNVDRFYSGLSVGIAPEQNYIGDQYLPILKTDLSKEDIVAFGDEAFEMIDDLVGDFAQPKKIDIKHDKITVSVDGHALEEPVSDRHQLESLRGPAQLDLEQEAIYTVKQRMLLRREKLAADLVTNDALYSADNKVDLNAAGERWDTAVDPIARIQKVVTLTLPVASGKKPNTFFASHLVWAEILANAAVKNRVFGANNPQGLVTEQDFAKLIGVQKVLIGSGVSRKGTVVTHLWGKTAGVAWVPPVTGRRIPAFGYTVEQRVFGDSSESVVRIRDEHMGAAGGWQMKRSHFYKQTLTFKDAGYLWYNVIA